MFSKLLPSLALASAAFLLSTSAAPTSNVSAIAPASSIAESHSSAAVSGYRSATYFANWCIPILLMTRSNKLTNTQGHLRTQLPTPTTSCIGAHACSLRLR